MEWFSLAELAGKPIIKWVIQMIRGKVRQSIKKRIEINLLECDARDSQYWCPIIFTLKIDSKTPARLRVIGTDYVVFHNGSPLQSGSWKSSSPFTTSGYEIDNVSGTIDIEGNGHNKLTIAVNPVMLGRWVTSNQGWEIKGVVYIDCAYGIINKPFNTKSAKFDAKRWNEVGTSFKQRFPELNCKVRGDLDN